MELVIDQVSKYYGNFRAVNDVSFTGKSGVILGIIGRNGAGKTTLLKMIMRILEPDKGQIRLDGDREGNIGYLPEERGLYMNMRVDEQLCFIAELNGLSRQESQKQLDYYLEALEITKYKKVKLNTLSKGNQQKVQLISALIHNPKIIILDEPFSGLDPVNANQFRKLILKEKELGKIILMSTHRLEDIETMCQEILFIKDGTPLLKGKVEDIIEQHGVTDKILVETDENIATILTELNIPFEQVATRSYIIPEKSVVGTMKLFEALHHYDIELKTYQKQFLTLNDIFVKEFQHESA